MPAIATEVPTGPFGGLKPAIDGMTLNTCGVTRLPPGSSTVTFPVVEPSAGEAIRYVSLTTVNVPAPVPNFTPVAFEKPCPRMPTDVPTLPDQITTREAKGFNPLLKL